jgi:hypothetical protein
MRIKETDTETETEHHGENDTRRGDATITET